MTTEEYEQEVKRTMVRPPPRQGHPWEDLAFSSGLCGEAGEVIELVKKHVFHYHDLDLANLKKELGDVLWYATALALTHGWKLSEVFQGNVDKLRTRYPDGFSIEASQKRGCGNCGGCDTCRGEAA